jgi:hypothetical protein
MTNHSLRNCNAIGRKVRFRLRVAISAIVLSMITAVAIAQEESNTCPCFSTEEVEAIFQRADQVEIGEGEIMCKAEDYSVELNAEITVMDKNYSVTAKASVKWFDFDPGACDYIDSIDNPGVERSERWPHPAPEATARLCYDIIRSVVDKSDSVGKCITS